MKYLLRDKKVEYSGSKKQLMEYVKNHYSEDYQVKEYSKFFDTDFGKFKFVVKYLGFELSDKMTNKEYNKAHRR